jgi:hypothetical protein
VACLVFLGGVALGFSSCGSVGPPSNEQLVAKGRDVFFKETFAGNGRTCGTCHPASNNFTIDPAFVASLPADDPLFVADSNANLGRNFESPILMREVGLIRENQDGFDDLANKFTMRAVPHTLGMRFSISSREGPRTGWSGDGAPRDGSLRSFAVGAVIQHYTRTLGRVPGRDFRLPTDAELDALEAFMLSLGRKQELTLPLPLRGALAARGQAIFADPARGKCSACHFNAGANADPAIFGAGIGNLNFNTGVADLPDQPAELTGELVPRDDGRGSPGDGTFNTPSLVEAADTGPFFHNNAVATIEGAVAFYDGDSFNNSPSGRLLAMATGGGIELDATEVAAVAAFLRVINTLENIRQSVEFLTAFAEQRFLGYVESDQLLPRAADETDDAIAVLAAAGLHPAAVAHLTAARRLTVQAMGSGSSAASLAREAIREHELARDELIES